MPRKAQPFFWEERQAWYYFARDRNGKRRRVRLAETEDEAYREWHRREGAELKVDSSGPVVGVLGEAFLDWVRENLKQATCNLYHTYFLPVALEWAERRVDSIKPFDLTQYLAKSKLPLGAQRVTIETLKACFNWGVKQMLIDSNPLASVEKPPTGRREETVDEADRQRVLAKTDAAFRLVVQALTHSGCRPQEVRVVTAGQFVEVAGVWVFPPSQHKTGKKTNKPRVIYLSPCLLTLSRILAKHRPTGPLFLNAHGGPWTHRAIRSRMWRLRRSLDLPDGTVAYSFRHTFATNALLAGVNPAELAELMGHRDLSMITEHYGHLTKHADQLKRALGRALGQHPPEVDQHGHPKQGE